MALLCVKLLRRNGFCCLSARLTRNFQVYTENSFCRKKVQFVSCQRTTNTFGSRATLNGRPPFLSGNVRTVLCQCTGPKISLPPLPGLGPVLMQSGYHFHTSAPLRALPVPLIWIILKPLQKLMAIILGRSIRKWWIALPANRRQFLREAAWRHRWQLAAGAAIVMVIISLFLLTHLDESPVTGRTRLLVFSREKYMELAALTSEVYMVEFAEALVPEHDSRHQVVEGVVQHLARRNDDIPEMSSVTWTVHVVQSPDINAFVLPNGKVFMFTGMLDAMADIHQLAIVLGHEMAHAIMGHSVEQASLSHVVDFLSLILLTAIWAVCPRDSLAVLGQWTQNKLVELMFSRPYSRKLEAEADKVGLQLAAKACADVRAGPVFWQQMEISDQLRVELTIPEWLSTHPSHRNRVAQLNRLVPEALELRESCNCPALPETDPRVVFAETVRVLLDNANAKKRGEAEGGNKALPHTPALPATLLVQPVQPPPLSVDLETKGPVPVPASDAALEVPVPATTEGRNTPAQGA